MAARKKSEPAATRTATKREKPVASNGKRRVRSKGAPTTGGAETYQLRLYVAGQTPRSTAAVANLQRLCAEHLEGKYSIEIVDLMKTPQLARDHQIIAVPTLVRQLPVPLKRIVGDLSDTERALVGLELRRSA